MEDFDDIYKESAAKVYKFLLKLSRDPELAEELTQETFYQAYLHLNDFRGDSALDTWLCQIAKNAYFREYSRRSKRREINEETYGGKDDLSEIENRDTAKHLYATVHRLQDPYKEVFMLRVFADLPFKEIASIHNKSESWAKMTFYRAKAEVIKRMENNDE